MHLGGVRTDMCVSVDIAIVTSHAVSVLSSFSNKIPKRNPQQIPPVLMPHSFVAISVRSSNVGQCFLHNIMLQLEGW